MSAAASASRSRCGDPGNRFLGRGRPGRREHATHEPLISRAMLEAVPLAGLSFGEWVVRNELAVLRVLEELPGPLDLPGDRGRGVFLRQPLPVVPGPAGMDLLDRLIGPEMRDEEPPGRLVVPQRDRPPAGFATACAACCEAPCS